jgi:putative transposase
MYQFDRNRHSVYSLYYHLVVATKYRKKCISKQMHHRLNEIAEDIFSRFKCELIEMDGEEDYIHLLFKAPPQVQLSKLINNFKTVSSRYIRKEFQNELSKHYWKPYFWSNSYMIFSTGGASLEVIQQYIEEQDKPSSATSS